jgi:hypothetical protein
LFELPHAATASISASGPATAGTPLLSFLTITDLPLLD